jgi:proline iminopeptidase
MDLPVQGPGERASASIDEGFFADLSGSSQWITLRGRRRDNPAMLILSGPGVAFSRLAPLFSPWETDFTLVQWDQPAEPPLSLERLVADAAAAIEVTRVRLGQDKLVVLGLSGGSVVGLMLARRRPDLLSAYVGSGQFVDYARQDTLSYRAVLDQARTANDVAAVAELEALGPPPWPDAESDAIVSRRAGALTAAEQAAFTPDLAAAIQTPPAGAAYVRPGAAPADPRARAMAAYGLLRAELKAFDARRLGARYEVPIQFIQGAQDVYSVTSEVLAYAAEIIAPRTAVAVIEGGGHSCFFLREAFCAHLRDFTKKPPSD